MRYKQVLIDNDIIYEYGFNTVLMSILRKLDDNVQLTSVMTLDSDTCFRFYCDVWDKIGEAEKIPRLYIGLPNNEIHQTIAWRKSVNQPVSQNNVCICDMAYTGLRYHKKECPIKD